MQKIADCIAVNLSLFCRILSFVDCRLHPQLVHLVHLFCSATRFDLLRTNLKNFVFLKNKSTTFLHVMVFGVQIRVDVAGRETRAKRGVSVLKEGCARLERSQRQWRRPQDRV